MGKILVLTNHSYMLYQFRKELLRALAQNHEVVLSMPFLGHEDDFQSEGFKCINTPLDRRGINPVTDFKLFSFYRALLKQEQPDLVITYSIKPNIYGGIACQLAGIPYCSNVQGLGTAFQKSGLAQFVTALYRFALKKARTVFFENRANADEFIRRHILTEDKITLLNGAGINLQTYILRPYPDNDPIRFLYLGRIMREKGISELFDAMRRLQKDGIPFVLDMVGFFEDEYKQQVEQLQQQGLICFHGFQSDPTPYYAQADCIVLPSYHEGMSNVLLEGAATGRPLITSNIPGCREAVEDGVTGLLCHVQDSQSLYEKMRLMASLPAQQRAQMGLAGREKMEAEFDKQSVVAATISALHI